MKRGVHLLTLAINTMLLGACAVTPSPEITAKRVQLDRTIPVCIDDRDCTAKWEAAQLWIARNAGYKLQIATNVLLETYNSVGGSTSLAVQVTKESLGGGRYRILVKTWCDNIFGCFPNAWDAALDFNRVVGVAAP